MKTKVQCYALIDSGADYNLFHTELTELIGIQNFRNDKEQTMFGIEGKGIKSYFHDIIIEIGGWRYKSYCGFTDFGGAGKLDKMPYGILGQFGLFDLFKISFDFEKLEIELKPKEDVKFIQ